MKSLAVKPKAFFPDFGSVSPSEPEHFLYGEKKEFEFRFLPGTVKTGDLLILAVDNDFNFYDPDPSNLTHCAPVMCLGRHEVTAEEAAEQKVEILLETQTADFRDKTNGCVRPLAAKMGLYKWSDESYSLLAIGSAYCHPVLATYDIPLSPIVDDSYYTKEQVDEKVDAKLDSPAAEGQPGQILGLGQDGSTIWKDEQEIPEQEQADWTEDDTTSPSYIQNKPDLSLYAEKSELATVATSGDYDDLSNKPSIPTQTSDLTNDSDFQTGSQVQTALLPYSLVTETGARLSMTVDSNYDLVVSLLDKNGNVLSTQDVDLPVESMVVSASYANGVLTLTLQNGQTLDVDISDIVSGLVPDSRTVNGHALSADVTVTASDLGLAAVATTGSYTDLSDKPVIPAAQVQADWDESDSSEVSFIQNKPALPTSDQLLPASTSSDEGKVLTVDSNGDAEWAEAQGGGSDPMDYLHFTALAANDAVRLDKSSSDLADVNLEYSTDKNTWTAYTWSGTTGATVTLANIGDKVWFRGNNASFSTSTSLYFQFTFTTSTGVSGNIMSLLDKTCQSVVLPVSYCFYRLFYNQYNLLSAEGLNLPATTLTTYCYKQMFMNSGIDGAPYLPAISINNYAYSEMFRKCRALRHAFDLPGCCTVGSYACEYMFSETALEKAPDLNVKFQGPGQYAFQYMFANCRKLSIPPMLFNMTMNGWSNFNQFKPSQGMCKGMLSGCISLRNPMRICFPMLDYEDVPYGPSSPTGCENADGQNLSAYESVFEGCTSLSEFPEFPPSLNGGDSYEGIKAMFKNCTSLPECVVLPHYYYGGDPGSDGNGSRRVRGFYSNMFEGANTLRRASLPDKFYLNCRYDNVVSQRQRFLYETFKDCSSLKYVKATFPAWGVVSGQDYTTNWLSGVASTGVFDCPAGLDTTTRDASHVPSGWTVCHNDYDASLEPASFAIPAASTAQLLLPPTEFSHAPSAATVYTLWHDPDKAVETVRIVVDMTTTNQVSFQDESGVAIPSGTWAVGSEVEFTCTYANGGWAVVGDDGSKGASQADVQSMIADALTMH